MADLDATPPAAGPRISAPWTARVPWLAWSLSATLAGVVLAALLVALVPASIVIRIGETGGLVPPMLAGMHAPERNDSHPIRWTAGRARLRWPGRFGAAPAAVVLTVAGFPGRQPDQVDVRINGRLTRHAVPDQYADIRVPVPVRVAAPLDIEITSRTTRPPADGRVLGIRLEAVTIENRPLAQRLAGSPGAAGIVALGAAAWGAGLWAAGAAATRRRRLRAAAIAWTIVAIAAGVLAPTALRADAWLTLLPVLVGAITAVWLGRAGHAPGVACAGGAVVAMQGLVITTWCVSAFVDVPRWDIWDLVPLLAKQEAQGLTLADLWAPHNEHRPTIARAVLLANVALTRWNHWNELWCLLGLTAAHVLVLVAYLRHAGQARPVATVMFLAGVGTFVATATQWENFLQGWQIALVAGAAAMSGAFLLLSTGTLTWARVVGAATLVLVGTAGFGSCLLGWPLGGAAMAARRSAGWRWKAAAWVATGGVVGLAYVHGLVRPPQLPPPAPILTSFTALAQVTYGTCLALGMPVWYAPTAFMDPHSTASWLLPSIGLAGLALSAMLIAVHLWYAETRRGQAWVFPALLITFAVGAGALTAIGRVPLGMHAMTASRYIVFTALFWVGVLLLLTVAAPFRSAVGRSAGVLLAGIIVLAGLRAWGDSLPYFEQHYVAGVRGREALLRTDWPKTIDIFPVAPVLDERRQYLQRRQLSLYRPGSR